MKPSTKLFFPLAMSMLLVACGSPAASSAPAPSSPAPTESSTPAPTTSSSVDSRTHKDSNVMDKDVTIYFMSNFSYQDPLDAIINKFKEVEPHITVKNLKETGGYPDVKNKAISQLATNEHPDLIVAYPDAVQEIMQYDKVVKLDDYINDPEYGWSAADKKDVIESYLSEGQNYPLAGTYSVPFAKSTEAMFYNKKLIGLNLASIDPTINGGRALSEEYINDLTWEELFGKLAPALLAYNEQAPADKKLLTSSKYEHKIFGYDSDDNLFITLAEQYGYGYTSIDEYGEGHLDFNNADMKGLMKTFNSAYKNKYFFTKGTNNNEYTNYTFTDAGALFSVGSTGGSKYQYSEKFETGVARIPHAAGKASKVINQGPALAILEHDKDRALASWLFYRFLTNEKNCVKWATDTGYAPIRYSALADEDYLEYADPESGNKNAEDKMKAITATYTADVGDTLFSSPVFKGSSTARAEVGSLMSKCVSAENLTDDYLNSEFELAIGNTKRDM